MSATSRLKQSRRQWKEKALTRGNSERYQRKELLRLKKERDHSKKAAREAQNQLAKERQKKPSLPIRSEGRPRFHRLAALCGGSDWFSSRLQSA